MGSGVNFGRLEWEGRKEPCGESAFLSVGRNEDLRPVGQQRDIETDAPPFHQASNISHYQNAGMAVAWVLI